MSVMRGQVVIITYIISIILRLFIRFISHFCFLCLDAYVDRFGEFLPTLCVL